MPEDSINFPDDRSYLAYVDNGDGTTSMYVMLFGGEQMVAILAKPLEEMIAEWMPLLLEGHEVKESSVRHITKKYGV